MFNVNIIDRTESMSRSNPENHVLTAVIEVKPPIYPGEGFNDVILGKDKFGVKLEHVLTSGESTIFLGEATLYNYATHDAMLKRVAARIGAVANSPAQLDDLSNNPFPSPINQG